MKKSTIVILLAAIFVQFSCSVFKGPRFDARSPILENKSPKFSKSDSLIGEHNQTFDVHYYDLEFDIDPASKSINGLVKIYFKNKATENVVKFDLVKHLIIDYVKLNGLDVKYTREYNSFFIDSLLEADKSYVVEIKYHGVPQVSKDPPWSEGFVWKLDYGENDWVGVTCEGTGAHIWWPTKDDTMDEADSARIKLIVPKGLKGISNGKLIEQGSEEGKDYYTWLVKNPINTYNITAYIGNFEFFTIPYESVDGNTYDLSFYVLPKDLQKAKKHFKQTITVLEAFEYYFGVYPWWEDGYKLVQSPFEGMEHQSAIAYGYGFEYADHGYGDYIIVHETAHEWWGNSVTAKDFNDLWLQEGFASYSEALMLEYVENRGEALEYLYFEHYLLMYNRKPVIGDYGVHYFDWDDTDIYDKGAATLDALRLTMQNDFLFFDILKTFASRYQKSLVETQDFIDLVTEKTGKDYTALFDVYLKQRKPPKLKFKVSKSKEEITLKWDRVPDKFMMPVYIYDYWGEEYIVFEVTNQSQTFELKPIKGVLIQNHIGYYKIRRFMNKYNLY